MKIKKILPFLLGILIYFILHVVFDVSRILVFIIVLIILYVLVNVYEIYKSKLTIKNLNQFADMTERSLEKLMVEKKAHQTLLHDIKNDLYSIRSDCESNKVDEAQEKVDALLTSCSKACTPPICSNMILDSLLSKFILDHPQIDFDIQIQIPETINMKSMDLATFFFCLFKEDLNLNTGNMKIHVIADKYQLRTDITYPENIQIREEDDSMLILQLLIKKYHGGSKVDKNHIKCIAFLSN